MSLSLSSEIELEVENECWFYGSDGPTLKCTVYNTAGSIIWRRDWIHISRGGMTVGVDRDSYNVSSHPDKEHHGRVERLHVSRSLAMSVLEQDSMFLCENRGFQSEHISLHVPGKQVEIMPTV